MSPLNKAYHQKRAVRLKGQKLAGWSPSDLRRLLKRQQSQHQDEAGQCAACAANRRRADELQREVERLQGELEQLRGRLCRPAVPPIADPPAAIEPGLITCSLCGQRKREASRARRRDTAEQFVWCAECTVKLERARGMVRDRDDREQARRRAKAR